MIRIMAMEVLKQILKAAQEDLSDRKKNDQKGTSSFLLPNKSMINLINAIN